MFIFPGIGLGVLASRARRVTNEMFIAAARALSACSPARQSASASLYPRVEDVREVSRRVAVAVGLAAQVQGWWSKRRRRNWSGAWRRRCGSRIIRDVLVSA